MHRRGFLAVTGAATIGGCSGLGKLAQEAVEESTPTDGSGSRGIVDLDEAPDGTPEQPAPGSDGSSDVAGDLDTIVPQITVASEQFNPLTLTLEVTLDVTTEDPVTITRQDGSSVIERYQIPSSGRRTLRGLTQGESLRASGAVFFAHVVGSERFSLEPRSGFEGLSYSSIPSSIGETYDRRFEYDIDTGWFGDDRVFTMSIPKAAYDYCKARPRIRGEYGFYGADPVNDEFANQLATELEANHGNDTRDAVDAAIGFVQSLKYTDDSVTAGYDEYQRYPIETLVDRGGDCEDTAILLGSILKEMGFGVKGLLLPGHMALGVKGTADIPGTYYEVDGARYYYVETTGDGWRVGDIPPEHEDARARLVDMFGYPVVNYAVRTLDSMSTGPMFFYTVRNDGDATARNIVVRAMLKNGSGPLDIANGTTETIPSLGPGESKTVPVMLFSPDDPLVWLHTQVSVDGQRQIDDEQRGLLT